MKFTRRHNRNGHQYEIGDKWTGDIDGARFLYHRGILEPDNDPRDHLVTSVKPVRGAAWSDANADLSTTPAEAGGTETEHGD